MNRELIKDFAFAAALGTFLIAVPTSIWIESAFFVSLMALLLGAIPTQMLKNEQIKFYPIYLVGLLVITYFVSGMMQQDTTRYITAFPLVNLTITYFLGKIINPSSYLFQKQLFELNWTRK